MMACLLRLIRWGWRQKQFGTDFDWLVTFSFPLVLLLTLGNQKPLKTKSIH